MTKYYRLEDLENIVEMILIEAKTGAKYRLENFILKGDSSVHLYTYEDIYRLEACQFVLHIIADNKKFVSEMIKLEAIPKVFCTYRARDIRLKEENQRRFKRVGYRQEIKYYIDGECFKAQGVDLSAGGLCMLTEEAPRFRGCYVELMLQDKKVTLLAQLVSYTTLNVGNYKLHMKFINVSQKVEQELCSYVLRLEMLRCRQEKTMLG